MGKVDGFLSIKRKDAGYRGLNERICDFKPVDLVLKEADLKNQSARCMDCGTPFCHSYGCPLGNIIPEINDLVYNNRWRDAFELLISTNNFPEFTGRICPALCEGSCVLGINDDPVTIKQIELAVIEKAYECGYMESYVTVARQNKKIAVIGSGPAGLTVADCLNDAGYYTTVFDSAHLPGGILRYGIPDFKLDKRVLDRRIALMKEAGIIFECGVTVGTDISFNYLKERFDAVCLACGSREPRDLDIPGRQLEGIYFAMQYLTQQNMRHAGEKIDPSKEISAEGKDVVVIGGGDTGSDCIGTAVRQKARSICQLEIMPRPPEKRAGNNPWPAWPLILRETSSHKEGGERRWCVTAKEFIGEKGKLAKVLCFDVEWHPGAGGVSQPKAKPGSEFEIQSDLVLLALGFTGPGRSRIADDLCIERDDRGNIKKDENGMTNVEGVFTSGDMTCGQSLVVKAIADGRKCAQGMIRYLSGKT